MSGGEIAALIAALAFVALVAVASVVLLRARGLLSEAEGLVRDLRTTAVPLLQEVQSTVKVLGADLDRVDIILSSAASVSEGVSGVASLVTSATANPLVKGLSMLAGARAGVKSLTSRKKK